MTSAAAGALADLTVVDFSTMLPGQTCSMIFADLGARVISVEHPGGGHYSRRFGLPASYESVNRNKESVTLDMKTVEGREVAQHLARRADVVLEGFRPGVATRLGIDYSTLEALNPRLVHCSISSYGQASTLRDLPGHDPNFLSVAGVLSLAGDPSGPPSADVGVSMADLASAWFAAISILAALRVRDRTGRGQTIDLAMADTAFALVQNRLTECLADPDVDKLRVMARPGVGLFEAADGTFLTVAAVEDHFWDSLCNIFGANDLLADPGLRTARQRRLHGNALRIRMANEFKRRTRDEWLTLLREADIPCAPVLSLREAAESPYARERGLIETIEHPCIDQLHLLRFPPLLSDTPATIRTRPPLLGEHTDAVLRELQYTDSDISRFRDAGIIR